MSSALVKENLSYFPFTLPRKTCQGKNCQGELASVYSQQVFLDKGTCQGKLASVNEALDKPFLLGCEGVGPHNSTKPAKYNTIVNKNIATPIK